MTELSTRARLAGGLAFAAVWGAALLLAVRSGDLTTPAGISTDPFPPGTITQPVRSEESCGDVEAPALITQAAAVYPQEFACLREAVDTGRRVVLVVRGDSEENDPMRVQLRVLAPDRIEVVVDNTRDRDGDGTIFRLLCTGIDPVTHRPTDCESVPLDVRLTGDERL